MNKDKTTRELALQWWGTLISLGKTRMCDIHTDIVGRIRRWETLTDDEIELIYISEHPQTEEQVKEVDILEENKRLKEVNKLLVDALSWIIDEVDKMPDFGEYGKTISESLILNKAKAALKEANLIK